MSNENPLEIAKEILTLLEQYDHYTAASALKIAHLVCEHNQTKIIYAQGDAPHS